MPADLHLHSVFSDGTFSPEEIVKRAVELGLDALSLTDHDTVNGWHDMEQACRAEGIRWVPGIELSTSFQDLEIHLLGYFPKDSLSVLPEKLDAFQLRRRGRIREMIARLKEAGIDWDVEEVFNGISSPSPGRPHVARALVELGVVSNVSNAFRKYLRKGKPGWVRSTYPSTLEMIQAIHADGGLAVLAHPGLGIPNEVLIDLASQGLDGVEVYHSSHKPSLIKKYQYLASQLNLIVTGGSDCHGHISGGPRLGKAVLSETQSDLFLQQLGLIQCA